jgi:hypothetical protein
MALGEWTLTRDRHPGDATRRPTPGLGVVPRLAVIPHFDAFGAGWVESARSAVPVDEGAVLLGLDERTAAVWVDGVWRAMGPGTVTVIGSSARETFASGAEIKGIPQPVTG